MAGRSLNISSLKHQDAPEPSLDFVALLDIAWHRKSTILGCILICMAVALAYLLTSNPQYESTASVLPPSSNSIVAFNAGRSEDDGVTPFTVDDVYRIFLRNLQSEALRQRFFEDLYLPSLSDTARAGSRTAQYDGFMRSLSIVSAEPVQRGGEQAPLGRYNVKFLYADQAQGAHWLQTYLDWVEQATKAEMIANVSSENQVLARNLQLQITGLRDSAAATRQDLLARLEEALRIAETIGLENPPIITMNGQSRVSASMNGPMTYMRGAKALRAEISNLQSRVSDDPFIPELRTLEGRVSYLRAMQIDPATVRVFIADGAVEASDRPVKPRKFLIMSLAFLLGGALGLIICVTQHLVSRREVPVVAEK
jgi:chain length determinant protein (polysaccharide antigen chain regulator)